MYEVTRYPEVGDEVLLDDPQDETTWLVEEIVEVGDFRVETGRYEVRTLHAWRCVEWNDDEEAWICR